MSLSTITRSKATILGNSAIAGMCTRPQAIPLVMIAMRKSIHGFAFLSYMSMVLCLVEVLCNSPHLIYQYSSIAPRLSGQNCNFFKFLLSLNSQRRLRYKGNNTKYRSLT